MMNKPAKSLARAKSRKRQLITTGTFACLGFWVLVVFLIGSVVTAAPTPSKPTDAVPAAEYISTIRQARALMLEGSYAAARQLLAAVPAEQREWEWGYLLEQCGAPPWKVDLPLGKDEKLHPSAQISTKLMPLAREILAEVATQEGNIGGTILSPGNTFAALFTGTSGRPGAHLSLVQAKEQTPKEPLNQEENMQNLDPGALARSYDPRVLFSLYSGTYGAGCRGVRFTPDGSCMVFVASKDACFTPAFRGDVGQTKENKEGDALFFVPLPPPPISSTGSGAEDDGKTVIRTPWQEQRFEQLPTDTQQAIEKIENFDKSTGAVDSRFADYCVNPEGEFIGLFNCFRSPHAAEVRELPSGKVIASLGKRCDFPAEGETDKTDINALLGDTDVGGAFSPDGTRAIVSPCADDGAQTKDEESADFGSVVAFRIADGSGTKLQVPRSADNHAGRTICPVWGWSPDSRYAFSSIFDGAEIENTLGVCNATTGERVTAVPQTLRYIAWSPDASRVYMLEHNSDSILVADPTTFKTLAAIPEATKPSGYPAFLDFPIYTTPDGRRFTVGRLVFTSDDQDKPLFRLATAPEKGPLVSSLLPLNQGNNGSEQLTIGEEALLYWVQESAKR